MVCAGNVERAGRERIEQAVCAEENFFMRGVVEEHGDDGVRAQLGFCGRGGGDRTLADDRLRAAFSAVPDCELVTGGQQSQSHGRAHLAES